MSYQTIQSAQISIPANTSSWGTIAVSGGTILSVGLQNLGFVSNAYPTQLFPTGSGTAFYQVDNRNSQPLIIQIWAVVDSGSTVTFGAPYDTGSNPLSN